MQNNATNTKTVNAKTQKNSEFVVQASQRIAPQILCENAIFCPELQLPHVLAWIKEWEKRIRGHIKEWGTCDEQFSFLAFSLIHPRPGLAHLLCFDGIDMWIISKYDARFIDKHPC